jgi:HAD superfamily phosphatase
MNRPLLVFDMDGVLVDVTESYRETIACTAEHFTGARLSNQQLQDYKNQGGWNDDWQLTHHIVKSAGVEVPFEDVRAKFQELFLGNGADGLILRERWIARPGVLEKLAENFRFAVFTGRPKDEAYLTLRRFAPNIRFEPVVAMEDVANRKPAPDGLLEILKSNCDCQVFYIGDNVDDAKSARAAKVPFIGIAGPGNQLYIDLVFLFQEQGAYAIVDDINYLGEVFES